MKKDSLHTHCKCGAELQYGVIICPFCDRTDPVPIKAPGEEL